MMDAIGETAPSSGRSGDDLPLVSVGVVTRNRPDELSESLQDLASQTYTKLEIIISDNASDDPRVSEIANRFGELDGRSRFVRHPENIGPGRNFSYVLQQATGEYFLWWSDDDRRDPRYIEFLLSALMKRADAALAFSDFDLVDRQGNHLTGYEHHPSKLKVMEATSYPLRSAGYFLQHPEWQKQDVIYGLLRRSVAMRSSIAIDAGDLSAADDQLLVYEFLQHGPLVMCEEPLIKLTVGNQKHYDARSIAGKTFLEKVRAELAGTLDEAVRAPKYVTITRGWMAFVIALLVPVKWVALGARLTLALPLRIALRRLRA